jgi:hypothetical protein
MIAVFVVIIAFLSQAVRTIVAKSTFDGEWKK